MIDHLKLESRRPTEYRICSVFEPQLYSFFHLILITTGMAHSQNSERPLNLGIQLGLEI